MTTENPDSGLQKSDEPTCDGTTGTTADPVEPQPVGYRTVFAVREFRPIFAAHVLSMFGSFFAEVALAVLVFQRTGSPLLTSLIFALGMLPYALSGVLLAGVSDRYPARRVLVTCDLLCAACVGVLALPFTPLALLFLLRAVLAMITPLFQGTRAASLADILEGDVYVLGRSLLRIISQSAQIVGFGIGGLVLVVLSPRAALTVAVATFLCSAALLRLGTLNRPARVTGNGSMMRQSLLGARQLLSHRRIRALLLWWWVPPMFFAVAEGLATPFAAAAGAGSAGVGLLLAAMPTGTVVSELAAGTLLSPGARTWIAMPLAGLALVPMALFAFHPPLPVAIGIMLVVGLCSAYALGMDKWFVEAVPEEMRGQAMSLLGAGMMTLQGLGMAVGGAIAEVAPPYAVISGAGILGTVSTLLVLRSVAATGRTAVEAV